jgi:hypothetical protein
MDISTPSAGVAVHRLTESKESNTIVVAAGAADAEVAGTGVVDGGVCACACQLRTPVLKYASMKALGLSLQSP